MGEDELEIGVLLISMLIAYEGVKSLLQTATVIGYIDNIVGGAVLTGITAGLGVGLLVLAYGVYEAKNWAWYITLPWFTLLTIGNLMQLGTAEFGAFSTVLHLAVVVYLVYVRKDFGVEKI